MRILLGLVAVLVIAASSSASLPRRTEVLRWSPLDSAGNLKRALKAEVIKGGECVDIGYTLVGGIAYRCSAGHWLFNACWREGPSPTEFVICTRTPWQRKVARLRSPNLLLFPGVTFDDPAPFPWAIELKDGHRCTVVQGAHDSFTAHGRRFVVDYGCEPYDDNLVLLREGIRRGRVWHANAARWRGLKRGYAFLGAQPIRRVYFGTLPPPLARQHQRAHDAVAAAKRVIRRTALRPHFELVWVRLVLPRADWARVIFEGSVANRSWSAVLHRVDGVWEEALAYKPYCLRLPRRVRRQLFLDRSTQLPQTIFVPSDDARC